MLSVLFMPRWVLSQQRASRWLGYTKAPLGVNERANVCRWGIFSLYPQCSWDGLQIRHDPEQNKACAGD